MDLTPVKVRVLRQGAIDVGSRLELEVSYRSESVLLASLDCRSKYGKVGFAILQNSPGLFLVARKDTIHLKRGHARTALTKIDFPELSHWEIHLAAWTGKTSIEFCFRRIDTPPISS